MRARNECICIANVPGSAFCDPDVPTLNEKEQKKERKRVAAIGSGPFNPCRKRTREHTMRSTTFCVSGINNVLSGLACVNQLFCAEVLILLEIPERKQLIFCSASQTMNGSSCNSFPPLFPARPLLRQGSNMSLY